MNEKKLYVRSLGRVSFEEGLGLQSGFQKSDDDYLLLLEHDPIYTLGSSTKPEHLKEIENFGVDIAEVDRGGSVTFHGPGQIVGYPIVSVEQTSGDVRGSLKFIQQLQLVLIEALQILGIEAIAKAGFTGVWADRGEQYSEVNRYQKIAAIGVKVAHGRTRHGFALNVSTDLGYFEKIVPCGIEDYGVTSLHELGFDHISFSEIEETITKTFVERFGYSSIDIASTWSVIGDELVLSNDIVRKSEHSRSESSAISLGRPDFPSNSGDLSRFSSEAVSVAQPSLRLLGRLSKAGVAVDSTKDRTSRPDWMKNKFRATDGYKELKQLSSELGLNTVCEEAGCPNIYECWEEKTATFMILGERCTRACSFCLVDTRKPEAVDPNEPKNVALAISKLGLDFAVITCVARDDLEDDGSNHFAQTVKEIRSASPKTQIELLISDCRGKDSSLKTIFDERPDVVNHNIETVARVQKAVRPSASYARSLSVLARAKSENLITKSGIIVGMGETNEELFQTLRDLKNVGVDIVTIGQYLQPTSRHLPVHRFVNPDEFAIFKEYGEKIGITHVESGPLVRSSYHAKSASKVAQ